MRFSPGLCDFDFIERFFTKSKKLFGDSEAAAKNRGDHTGRLPFMAHIGMLPQSVREEGGYRIKGRTQSEAGALLANARAVEKAGAFSVVLEIVVADIAKQITKTSGIPMIGIGSDADLKSAAFVCKELCKNEALFTRPSGIRHKIGNSVDLPR